MKLKDYILILLLAGDALLLYFAVKVDLTTIILLLLIAVVFRLFRATIYTKIEKRIRSRAAITSIYPEWVIRLSIIIFFAVSLVLLKWIVFEFFKLFGFDIELTLTESIKRFAKQI